MSTQLISVVINPEKVETQLDEALRATFPASDPVALCSYREIVIDRNEKFSR